jgi:two-component system CheB/CheR fusion protein
LGLAIVRYVVEAHGGNITAASEGRGKGSTFTVLLPLMKSKPVPASRREPGASDVTVGSLKNARILVVEDDEGTRDALTEMLDLTEANVHSVESPARAMMVFEEFKPDLVVCDVAMPDEDGYSLLRRIRALGSDRGGDVPAMALTALASEEDRRRAFDAGFQLHVAKPVDANRLVTALRDLIRQRAPRREAGERPPPPG